MREMSGNRIFEKDSGAGSDFSGCYPPVISPSCNLAMTDHEEAVQWRSLRRTGIEKLLNIYKLCK